MKKKKQFYETPQSEFCVEFSPADQCLVSVSADDHFIDDSDPYFD